MRVIVSLIWAALFITMLNYVASSIHNVEFVLEATYLPIVLLVVGVIALAAIIPDESTPDHD